MTPASSPLLVRARDATVASPASIDLDSLTGEMVAATGADVLRLDAGGPFVERLKVTPEAVDLSRLIGAPVLDSHRQDSLDRVLGVVASARIESGQLIVGVRFREAAKAILSDIAAGLIRGVSVGYSVQQVIETKEGKNRVRTGTRWTPTEVSIVAVPADPKAVVRSHQETPMTDVPLTPAAVPAGASPAMPDELQALCRVAGLENDFIVRHASTPADEVRTLVAAHVRAQAVPAAPITAITPHATLDDPTVRTRAMADALYSRAYPSETPPAEARPYMGESVAGLAELCLRAAGVTVFNRAPGELITRALHSTSDFAAILANVAQKTARRPYSAAPQGIRLLARQAAARDFRDKSSPLLGEAPTLERVGEHGEFKSGSIREADQAYRVETFGRIIGLTRQALINDDLGTFAGVAERIGQAALDFEARQMVARLVANSGAGQTMSADNQPLFHATHGNIATGALSETALSSARLLMRRQTGLSGALIAMTPAFLLCPPELETTAEKLLATVQPTRTTDVNPFDALTLVIEPRLTNATRWYLVAAPAQADGLEYSYLEGSSGVQIEQQSGFDVDGVRFRARLDFGCAFLDWRSWVTSPGL